MDLEAAGEKRLLQLNELDEFRREAYENAKLYKERTKVWQDKGLMTKEFELGQQVLLFNARLNLFPGKLKSRWTDPYIVMKAFPYGAVEIKGDTEPKFKVNGQRLKLYLGGQLDYAKSVMKLVTV